jgi:murein DD-endopeptidase MepM/ murein hydrolase activator NlpD
MIKLQLPLRDISVNQPFGTNFVDFYQKLGLKGHNGVDFKAYTGFNCYAAHQGKITVAGPDNGGGIAVEIVDEDNHFKTTYYHLEDVNVRVGEHVAVGQLIASCDNTGILTTGSHLHFGLKELDNKNFNTINYNNGYKGAIDPTPYFVANYNGVEINNKDCYKSNAYHRYFRGRPKGGLVNEVKVIAILTKKGIAPTAEKVNALVYGGWDLEAVQNPAMYEIWGYLKKDEYTNKGLKPFQN